MTMTSSSSTAPTALETIWDNVKTIIYALALAMAIRFTIVQPFRIPSGSMQPTLEVGDYIIVTKWSYGYGRYSFAPLERLLPHGRLFGSQPQRGDVVVFRPSPDPNRDLVKRLIGMPGDRVQVTDGVVSINGTPVPRESLGPVFFDDPNRGPIEIPAYRETLPNGVRYTVFDRTTEGELDDTRVFEIPEGHYFFMGDDRDNSQDSRTFQVGNVPYDNLVGPAPLVIASFDGTTSIFKPWTLITGFRPERFLKSLRGERVAPDAAADAEN